MHDMGLLKVPACRARRSSEILRVIVERKQDKKLSYRR